ncbi:hypothetical protein BH10ACT7_BH10ACT7_16580 [soil metagenome]
MSQSRSLRGRVAGQSAMSAVVLAQAGGDRRTVIQRLFGASPLTATSKFSYRAALGELLVGDMLENLGPSWDVLHGIPLGDALLDHLVIGPAGVFAVRAINCTDQEVLVEGDLLVVAGEARNDIPCSIADAASVGDLLSDAAGVPVPVQALLVVVDAARLTVRRPPNGLQLVASRDVHRMLTRASLTLTGDEVARVSDLADLEGTWPRRSADELDTQRLSRDFTIIRAQVRAALGRRITWAAAGIGLLYGLVWGVIAALVETIVRP